MLKGAFVGLVSTIAMLSASAAAAQSWSVPGTAYPTSGGTADLQHSVILTCVVNPGAFTLTPSSPASGTAKVSGVTYPFSPPDPLCAAVDALGYDWDLVITGGGSGGVYNVELRNVSAHTLLGATCTGTLYGTYTNGSGRLQASGTIPATGIPPATCYAAVDISFGASIL